VLNDAAAPQLPTKEKIMPARTVYTSNPQFTPWERFREFAGTLGLAFGLLALIGVFMVDDATDDALNSIASQTTQQLAAVQNAPADKPIEDISIVVDYSAFNFGSIFSNIFGWITSNLVLLALLALAGYLIYDKAIKNRRKLAKPTP
jgi:hypothetical protein